MRRKDARWQPFAGRIMEVELIELWIGKFIVMTLVS